MVLFTAFRLAVFLCLTFWSEFSLAPLPQVRRPDEARLANTLGRMRGAESVSGRSVRSRRRNRHAAHSLSDRILSWTRSGSKSGPRQGAAAKLLQSRHRTGPFLWRSGFGWPNQYSVLVSERVLVVEVAAAGAVLLVVLAAVQLAEAAEGRRLAEKSLFEVFEV